MYLQIQFQLIFPSRRHKSLFLQFFPKLIINGSASLFPRHPRFFNHPSSMIIAGISKRHPLNGLIKNSNGALPRFSPGFNITTSHLPFSISPVFRCATRRERRNPFVSPIFVHRARPWKQCGVGNRCGPRHRRLWQADWCRRITHQDLSRLRLIAAFNRNSCGLTEGLLSGSTLPFFFFNSKFRVKNDDEKKADSTNDYHAKRNHVKNWPTHHLGNDTSCFAGLTRVIKASDLFGFDEISLYTAGLIS